MTALWLCAALLIVAWIVASRITRWPENQE